MNDESYSNREKGRFVWDFVDKRLSPPALAVVVLLLVIGTVVWGYHIQSNQSQQGNQIAVIAKNYAQREKPKLDQAATAAKKSLQIVASVPFIATALEAGQAQLNIDLAWIDCRLGPNPTTCGSPPPMPIAVPAQAPTTTTLPSHK